MLQQTSITPQQVDAIYLNIFDQRPTYIRVAEDTGLDAAELETLLTQSKRLPSKISNKIAKTHRVPIKSMQSVPIFLKRSFSKVEHAPAFQAFLSQVRSKIVDNEGDHLVSAIQQMYAFKEKIDSDFSAKNRFALTLWLSRTLKEGCKKLDMTIEEVLALEVSEDAKPQAAPETKQPSIIDQLHGFARRIENGEDIPDDEAEAFFSSVPADNPALAPIVEAWNKRVENRIDGDPILGAWLFEDFAGVLKTTNKKK